MITHTRHFSRKNPQTKLDTFVIVGHRGGAELAHAPGDSVTVPCKAKDSDDAIAELVFAEINKA